MRFVVGLAVTLAAAGAWAQPPRAPVQVSGAWARATLPHQDTGVVYLTLVSPGGDVLTGADCPDAGMAMLHRNVRSGTMESMVDVDSVPLPAGQAVALAPSGMHIMLMNLKHALKAGAFVRVTLHFARAPAQDLTVPVRPAAATGP